MHGSSKKMQHIHTKNARKHGLLSLETKKKKKERKKEKKKAGKLEVQ